MPFSGGLPGSKNGHSRADDHERTLRTGWRFAGAPRHRREQIAHEMDPTPLPRRSAEDGGDRLLEALLRIRRYQPHAAAPPLDHAAEEAVQKARFSDGPTSMPRTCRSSSLLTPTATDGRLARHAPIDAHLVIRGIDPEVRIVGRERARAKPVDDRIELGADS